MHNPSPVDPDVEPSSDDVDVRRGVPLGARMRPVRVTERDVNPWKLLVLKDVSDDTGELDVGAYREFADTIGVFVRMRIAPERVFELLVVRMRVSQPVVLDANGERRVREAPETFAEIVSNDPIDHKCTVHVAGRREDLAAWQIAPFLGTDETTCLHPSISCVERADEIAAGRCRSANLARGADDLQHAYAQPVDALKIRAHAFAHDLPRDVHHVGMAHMTPIDDIGELHPRFELVRLHVHGENADVAQLHVCGNGRRQRGQRTGRDVLENEGRVPRADILNFANQAGGDFLTRSVRDECHAFLRLDGEAHANGVARAGAELAIERCRHQLSPACVSLTIYRMTSFRSFVLSNT